jgi:hypothetical protein
MIGMGFVKSDPHTRYGAGHFTFNVAMLTEPITLLLKDVVGDLGAKRRNGFGES